MKKTLLIVGLCAFASQAFAETAGLNYSYIRLGYTEETLHGDFLDDLTLSGTALDFSMDLNDSWAVTASRYLTDDALSHRFDPLSVIFRPVSVSQEFTSAGALYHHPLLERTDLLASIEYATWEYWFLEDTIFAPAKNRDENGYRISLGLKSGFLGSFEGAVLLRQFKFLNQAWFEQDLEDTINEAVIEGNYYFLERYHLGGSYIQNDHSDRFVVHMGYSF